MDSDYNHGSESGVTDNTDLSPDASARVRRAYYRGDEEVLKLMRPSREGDALVGDAPVYRDPFRHLEVLPEVLACDLEFILQKDIEYNASWKARGGVGAFMMLARKWDRLEPLAKTYGYDVFAMVQEHPERIDDIRDLRRYLALVESELVQRGVIAHE